MTTERDIDRIGGPLAQGDGAGAGDRVDGQRDLPGWGVRLLAVGWPSFLAACALELVVFAFVDPHDLGWSGQALHVSRQTVYSVSFFVFWAVVAAACWLAARLSDAPQQAPEA